MGGTPRAHDILLSVSAERIAVAAVDAGIRPVKGILPCSGPDNSNSNTIVPLTQHNCSSDPDTIVPLTLTQLFL